MGWAIPCHYVRVHHRGSLLALGQSPSRGSQVVWEGSPRLDLGRLGSFNLVEGVIDHHILQIHHVRSGPNELAWDITFLALGAVLLVGGWTLARSDGHS